MNLHTNLQAVLKSARAAYQTIHPRRFPFLHTACRCFFSTTWSRFGLSGARRTPLCPALRWRRGRHGWRLSRGLGRWLVLWLVSPRTAP